MREGQVDDPSFPCVFVFLCMNWLLPVIPATGDPVRLSLVRASVACCGLPYVSLFFHSRCPASAGRVLYAGKTAQREKASK